MGNKLSVPKVIVFGAGMLLIGVGYHSSKHRQALQYRAVNSYHLMDIPMDTSTHHHLLNDPPDGFDTPTKPDSGQVVHEGSADDEVVQGILVGEYDDVVQGIPVADAAPSVQSGGAVSGNKALLLFLQEIQEMRTGQQVKIKYPPGEKRWPKYTRDGAEYKKSGEYFEEDDVFEMRDDNHTAEYRQIMMIVDGNNGAMFYISPV